MVSIVVTGSTRRSESASTALVQANADAASVVTMMSATTAVVPIHGTSHDSGLDADVRIAQARAAPYVAGVSDTRRVATPPTTSPTAHATTMRPSWLTV